MLLFSAPLDFDLSVMNDQEWMQGAVLKYVSPYANPDITEWICSPVNQRFIDGAALDQYPNLRLLATASTGTNHINLDACAARGIKVLSLLDDRDGLNTISASAEWTFKLILEGLRLKRPYHELQDRRVAVIGYGRIGQKIEAWCKAFGAGHVGIMDAPKGHIAVPQKIFRRYDIVVICCSLTDDTRGMVTYEWLRHMRPDAVLVNTARGEVINENDLCRFMAARPDVRVCLDVVTGEVDGTANPERLRQLGAYVSDHIAGETFESRTKAARIILGLLKKEMVTE